MYVYHSLISYPKKQRQQSSEQLKSKFSTSLSLFFFFALFIRLAAAPRLHLVPNQKASILEARSAVRFILGCCQRVVYLFIP